MFWQVGLYNEFMAQSRNDLNIDWNMFFLLFNFFSVIGVLRIVVAAVVVRIEKS